MISDFSKGFEWNAGKVLHESFTVEHRVRVIRYLHTTTRRVQYNIVLQSGTQRKGLSDASLT